MLRAFLRLVFFKKVYELSFISRDFARFETILHSCQCESYSMNFLDAKIKLLDTETFPQPTIADLNSGLHLFCSVRGLYCERKYTHTHKHIHVHIHTDSMFLTTIRTFKPTFIFACPDNIYINYTAMNGLEI